MLRRALFLVVVAGLVLACSGVLLAQSTIKVEVLPEEAYVWLDGRPFGHPNFHGNLDTSVAPGKHTITITNYGFKPMTEEVDLAAGEVKKIHFTLEKIPERVNGPFGRIRIQGADQAAILLNGTTPEYFVGHGDEFNYTGDQQWLLVPPGKHMVYVMQGVETKWSGEVTIAENERINIVLPAGTQSREAWKPDTKLVDVKRFSAGMASAVVAVAPVVANFSADRMTTNCGQSVRLNWGTKDTVDRSIVSTDEHFDGLPATGEQLVQPLHTTIYTLRAAGPGGMVERSVTVSVNTTVDAALNASEPTIHYVKVGDKLLVEDTSELNWTVNNAQKITLDHVGEVAATGRQVVVATPQDPTTNVIDEARTYRLVATNPCQGSATKTVTVHVKGTAQSLLGSIFFPTAYPTTKAPMTGLVGSQKESLDTSAETFKTYLAHTPDAKLLLMGYADVRGTKLGNLKLSERRVMIVKQYLIAAGVPPETIETQFFGHENVLAPDEVKQLEAENPEADVSEATEKQTEHAYNRRVDLVINPAGIQSTPRFPHTAVDVPILYELTRPNAKEVGRVE